MNLTYLPYSIGAYPYFGAALPTAFLRYRSGQKSSFTSMRMLVWLGMIWHVRMEFKRDIPTEAVMVVPSAFEGLSGSVAFLLNCSTIKCKVQKADAPTDRLYVHPLLWRVQIQWSLLINGVLVTFRKRRVNR